MQLKLRTNNDYRTTGVVNTLTQKVLTETTLLTLEQITQGLQCAVSGSSYRTTTTSVIKQGVNSLLQHAHLVVQNGLGNCTKVNESLQTVITVDNPAVEIIQITCCEATTI